MPHLILLTGEHSHARRAAADAIVREFVAVEGDMNLTRLDGGTTTEAAIIASAETLPFLGTRRLTVVTHFDFKKKTELLAEFVKNIPSHATLVISTDKADARTTLYKAIKKHGDIREFGPPSAAEFGGFIDAAARERKLTITPDARELLQLFVGGSTETAIRELDKLAAYIDGQTVTRNDVAAITHPDITASVFTLTDAIGSRRIETALATLSQLEAAGENLVQILFMVARQIRILLSIRALLTKNTPAGDIASELKLHPFVVRQALAQAKLFTDTELTSALQQLLAIDAGIKTGRISYTSAHQTELALELEKLIISFAR